MYFELLYVASMKMYRTRAHIKVLHQTLPAGQKATVRSSGASLINVLEQHIERSNLDVAARMQGRLIDDSPIDPGPVQ